MFKFIHAADIHLDSPLRGLEQYEGAPTTEIRGAARRALENLVDLAIEESVRFLLIAGDFYDGDWRDYNTGLFFTRQMTRLREANIPVYLIAGNHDAANRMTRHLKLPDNVHLLSSGTAETKRITELDVAIHGQSFATAAVYDNLAAAYPAPQSGMLNIGLLHTCATSTEHERYAPCSLDDLKLKGYDYWALGHVHTRQTFSETPWIGFSGNLQGRHIRETGPKGCMLVTVSDDRSLNVEFRELDVLRWERAIIETAQTRSAEELLDHLYSKIEHLQGAAAGRFLALRVEFHGATEAHQQLQSRREHWTQEVRARAIEAGRGDVWVEKVKFRTRPPQDERAEDRIDASALGEIRSLFETLRQSPHALCDWEFRLDDLSRKLPGDLKALLQDGDADWLNERIAEAESILLEELLSGKESA
ncbi:exonuclease SbcCD subunit D [Rubinisphaera sp. JC750]|uniref:metallophosphoesterase family protein n=1 Tax=Rubinisphaera sp. JC750 TaxID=2898658 RepID=UPI001F3D723A|nr:DNA repair exonuclease [Rubinisphaera sp. JC750]